MAEHKIPSMFAPNTGMEAYMLPLVYEPGTRFRYSIGIDWAGFLVTRITGMNLEEYFQKHIFAPCGVEYISFHPPADYDEKKMAMTEREPLHTGDVKVMKGAAMGRNLDPKTIGPIYSGGGGLFGTARDYLRILTAVLASSDSSNSKSLISPESFRGLFTDALPDIPAVRADVAKMAQGQHIHDPAILTDGTGEHVGYSPGLFLNFIDSKWGRLAMSGFWDGAAKTMFWIDPKTGIAVSRN
jgi:methyl acetate hydrolase